MINLHDHNNIDYTSIDYFHTIFCLSLCFPVPRKLFNHYYYCWIPWVCCIPYTHLVFIVSVGVPTINGMLPSSTPFQHTPSNQAATPQLNIDDSSIVTDREEYPRILRTFQFPCTSIFDTNTCRFRTKWVSSAQFPSNFFPIVHIYSLRLQTSQITTNLQMPRTGPPTTILQPRQQGQPITTSALTASQEQFFVVATAI